MDKNGKLFDIVAKGVKSGGLLYRTCNYSKAIVYLHSSFVIVEGL